MTTIESINCQAGIASLAETRPSWNFPPANLKLESGEVHIWLAQLDKVENAVEFEQMISEDERVRADRFRFDLHRKQFVAARGFLRIILGKYLQTNPRQLYFKYNKYGKPAMGEEYQSAIEFNLSHSDNLALYAVAFNREIGIDLERLKPSWIEEAMVFQCLTPQETAHFQSLPENERNLYFFDCWTRKEAYLKACGNGLSLPVNQIETSLSSEFSMSLLRGDSASRPTFGSFQTLPSIPGYAAALAVEGTDPQLKFWMP